MNNQIINLYKAYLNNPVITTDSRKTPKGSIFFALKGEKFDGNKFALAALKDGCSLAIVDDESLKNEKNCFYVSDVLQSLQGLAKHHRKQLNIPIIGITGTNGKTTTKELIARVLEKKFKTFATKGNLNNHIGVPLSILSITHDHEIAVIEMGANHIGEIKFLSEIAHPTHGIITNIGHAHLEGFGSFEGVIEAKTELYRHLKLGKDSIVFINKDNNILIEHTQDLNTCSYGLNNADNIFESIVANPFVEMQWQGLNIQSKLIGKYNAENIMAAITIGSYFNIEKDKIASAINEYTPKNQRSEIVKTEHNEIILDAYNANPSSMRLALENFKEMNKSNPYLILGDMFELGGYSLDEHKRMVELVSNLGFENACFIGKDFYSVKNNNFNFLKSTEEAIEHFKQNKLRDNNILIKGSRGMKLESLLPYL